MKELLTTEQRRDFLRYLTSILDDMRIPKDVYMPFYWDKSDIEFDKRFRALIQEFFLDPTNPFAREKVIADASWNYSRDGGIWPTDMQVTDLHDKLGLQEAFGAKVVEYPVDERADGIIVFPFLRDIGIAFDIHDPTGEGYGILGKRIWNKAFSTPHKGTIHNFLHRGELSSDHIRLNGDIRAQLEALEAKVPTEEGEVHYHAMPVNTGSLFAGYSPRNARVSALQIGILPLGFVQVLCIVLVWPERLREENMLWIECPADEFSWNADDSWMHCPVLYFENSRLKLSLDRVESAGNICGSAVAFPGAPN